MPSTVEYNLFSRPPGHAHLSATRPIRKIARKDSPEKNQYGHRFGKKIAPSLENSDQIVIAKIGKKSKKIRMFYYYHGLLLT